MHSAEFQKGKEVSIETTTRCDICGKVKGPNNGWWKAIKRAVCTLRASEELAFIHWNRDLAGIDLCGMQCATQALARFMNGQPLVQP